MSNAKVVASLIERAANGAEPLKELILTLKKKKFLSTVEVIPSRFPSYIHIKITDKKDSASALIRIVHSGIDNRYLIKIIEPDNGVEGGVTYGYEKAKLQVKELCRDYDLSKDMSATLNAILDTSNALTPEVPVDKTMFESIDKNYLAKLALLAKKITGYSCKVSSDHAAKISFTLNAPDSVDLIIPSGGLFLKKVKLGISKEFGVAVKFDRFENDHGIQTTFDFTYKGTPDRISITQRHGESIEMGFSGRTSL